VALGPGRRAQTVELLLKTGDNVLRPPGPDSRF
jgi:hypothetical protein